MMTEKEIEDRIIDKLNGLQIENLQIIGTWSAAAEGDVAGKELEENSVLMSVQVNPRAYDTAQIPTCSVTCGIGVIVPYDRDPAMRTTLCVSEKLMDLLQAYQDDLFKAQEDLSTEHFDLAGFRLDGGYGIQRDNQNAIYTLSLNFTLRGVIR